MQLIACTLIGGARLFILPAWCGGAERRGGGANVYDLYIANKNYSSWSLRPWVLMRELKIPFREHLVPFGQ